MRGIALVLALAARLAAADVTGAWVGTVVDALRPVTRPDGAKSKTSSRSGGAAPR